MDRQKVIKIIAEKREREFENLVRTKEVEIYSTLDFDTEASAIHIVAQKGTVKMLEVLLEDSFNLRYINSADNNLRTPLHYACQGGNLETAKYLISKWADVNLNDSEGRNTLMYAVMGGNPDVVRLILQHIEPSKVFEKDESGKDALDYAIEMGNLEIVKALVEEAGFQPGEIPYEIEDDNLRRYLRKKGFQVKKKKKPGRKVQKRELTEEDIIEMAQEDMESLLRVERNIERIAKILTEKKKIKLLRKLISRLSKKKLKKADVYTLISAILSEVVGIGMPEERAAELIRYIVEKLNFDIDYPVDGKTLLQEEVAWPEYYWEEPIKKVKILLLAGADPNIPYTDKDFNKKTPLHMAVENGALGLVKTLVEHGADVNREDNLRYTPLAYALRENRPEIVEYLRSKGGKV